MRKILRNLILLGLILVIGVLSYELIEFVTIRYFNPRGSFIIKALSYFLIGIIISLIDFSDNFTNKILLFISVIISIAIFYLSSELAFMTNNLVYSFRFFVIMSGLLFSKSFFSSSFIKRED